MAQPLHCPSEWTEVSRAEPCRVCGKPDWCSRSSDGAAMCRRPGDATQERVDKNGASYWLYLPEAPAVVRRKPRTPGRTTFEYLDEQGRPYRCSVRVVDANGDKQCYPGAPDGNGGWNTRKGATEKLRPLLFHLDRLAARPGERVFFVEGEPSASALASLGVLATTAPGGSNGALDQREFAVLLGRDVILWPDNDEAGRDYARRLIETLRAVGAKSIRVLQWDAAPPKGDAADWAAIGGTRLTLDELAASAVDAADWLLPSTPEKPAAKPKKASADDLVRLCQQLDLFRGSDSNVYATLPTGNVARIDSADFRAWLRAQCAAVPSRHSIADAVAHLQDCTGGDAREVALRFAGHEGFVFWDLANDAGEVVRIGPNGWDVVVKTPVAFVRPGPMQALPVPLRGGSLELLGKHFNLPTRDEQILAAAWALGCLNPTGAKVILNIEGEQGSTKTTTGRGLAALLDPRSPSDTNLPSVDDLPATLQHRAVPVFDNISSLSPAMADTLCRVSTGAGFAKRKLYTDCEEYAVSLTRPLVLTGIAGVVRRSDLADRTVTLSLKPLPSQRRRTEAAFWAALGADLPLIMGALCDACSAALRNAGKESSETQLPRMADWYQWILAAEEALFWEPGEFTAAYAANRRASVATLLEDDPVGAAVIAFCEKRPEWHGRDYWRGTPAQLLGHLGYIAGPATKAPQWPSSSAHLARHLKRLSVFLSESGIEVSPLRSNGVRYLQVAVKDSDGQSASSDGQEGIRHCIRHCEKPYGDVLSGHSDGQGRLLEHDLDNALEPPVSLSSSSFQLERENVRHCPSLSPEKPYGDGVCSVTDTSDGLEYIRHCPSLAADSDLWGDTETVTL